MKTITRLLATGLYTGYSPFAPGTAGSLLAVFIYWLLPGKNPLIFSPLLIVLFFLGVWSANKIEIWSDKKDNPIIVIDEIVGMLVTLTAMEKSLNWLAIGFILFRLFDIVKLFPAKNAEKLSGGWGVMADDVVAGIQALICLQALHYFFAA